MALKKTIRITRVNVSNLIREQGGNPEELESAFTALQGSLSISTEKDRVAAEAEANAAIVRAEAAIAQAQAQKSFLGFLRLSSGYSNLVGTERNWLPPFRDKEGDICIENPFTLRDQRNAARKMHHQMTKAGDDNDAPDIFEEDGEDNQ